jgi:hypothetical protein
MDFAPAYLLQRFFYRIGEFFRNWYVDGSRAIGNRFMLALAVADQSFAIKVTLRHFFEPLYKDYSAVGRVMGVIFRAGRILLGAAIYIAITLAFAAVFIIWLAIPVAILWYIATGIY